MADYFSLIERAVAPLAPDNASGRAEKYRQAEKALTNYLAGVNPPMSADGIATEMAALSDACRRVEAKFTTSPPEPAKAPVAAVKPEPAPQSTGSAPVQRPPLPQRPPTPEPMPEPMPAPVGQSQRPVLKPENSDTGSMRESQTGSRRGNVLGMGLLFAALAAIAIAAVTAVFFMHPKPLTKPVASVAAPAPANKPEAASTTPQSTPPQSTSGQPPAAPAKSTAEADNAGTPAATAPAAGKLATAPADTSTQDQSLVASHALLVVQVPPPAGAADAQPGQKSFTGTATWHLADINAAGQPLQKAVVADVEIPDADTDIKVTIQKNTDKVFPASHTIRVDFKQLEGNKFGAVKAMLMPGMREDEKPSGTPLTGLITPVLDNHFIVALQDDPAVEATNLKLLKSRPWMDLRVRFATGQIGLFSIEKGPQGDQVLGDAFKSWGQ